MSKRNNELGKLKYFANRGVTRNKTRLPNLRIKVIINFNPVNCFNISEEELQDKYKEYKFKKLGYINVLWTKELDYNGQEPCWNYDYNITVHKLKDILGHKQWSKFCQGKRYFIIQRRFNGKNISI